MNTFFDAHIRKIHIQLMVYMFLYVGAPVIVVPDTRTDASAISMCVSQIWIAVRISINHFSKSFFVGQGVELLRDFWEGEERFVPKSTIGEVSRLDGPDLT